MRPPQPGGVSVSSRSNQRVLARHLKPRRCRVSIWVRQASADHRHTPSTPLPHTCLGCATFPTRHPPPYDRPSTRSPTRPSFSSKSLPRTFAPQPCSTFCPNPPSAPPHSNRVVVAYMHFVGRQFWHRVEDLQTLVILWQLIPASGTAVTATLFENVASPSFAQLDNFYNYYIDGQVKSVQSRFCTLSRVVQGRVLDVCMRYIDRTELDKLEDHMSAGVTRIQAERRRRQTEGFRQIQREDARNVRLSNAVKPKNSSDPGGAAGAGAGAGEGGGKGQRVEAWPEAPEDQANPEEVAFGKGACARRVVRVVLFAVCVSVCLSVCLSVSVCDRDRESARVCVCCERGGHTKLVRPIPCLARDTRPPTVYTSPTLCALRAPARVVRYLATHLFHARCAVRGTGRVGTAGYCMAAGRKRPHASSSIDAMCSLRVRHRRLRTRILLCSSRCCTTLESSVVVQ